MHGVGSRMPLRFAHIHSKRTSGGPTDEMYDSERLGSVAMTERYDHFAAGAGYSTQDEPMEGMSAVNASISHVKRPLTAESYSKFDLLYHLHRISRGNTSVVSALGDVYLQRKELTVPTLFSLDSSTPATDGFPSCEVYDVDPDCLSMMRVRAQIDSYDDANESYYLWDLIKVRSNITNAPFEVLDKMLKPALGREHGRRSHRENHVSHNHLILPKAKRIDR